MTDDTEVTIQSWEVRALMEGPRDGPQTKRNRVILNVSGFDKPFRVNAFSNAKLTEAYGEETDDWIGRRMILYPDKINTPSGMVWSVCVRIPKAFMEAKPASKMRPVARDDYGDDDPPPADDSRGF